MNYTKGGGVERRVKRTIYRKERKMIKFGVRTSYQSHWKHNQTSGHKTLKKCLLDSVTVQERTVVPRRGRGEKASKKGGRIRQNEQTDDAYEKAEGEKKRAHVKSLTRRHNWRNR